MRIAIVFVADSKTKYLYQSLRLLVSINNMPSAHSVSAFVGVFSGTPSYFTDEFTRLGAAVLTLSRYSEIHGPSNKMAVLRHEGLDAFDYVVMCDCDVIFTRSLDPLFERNGVQAKIADLKTLPDRILKDIFDLAKKPFPKAIYLTTIDRQKSIIYCNAGMLVFSQSIFSSFVNRWFFWNDFVLSNIHVLNSHKFFADQASLCLTLSEFSDHFIELGAEMNFPTHISITKYPQDTRFLAPVVVHYHDCVWEDSGELRDFPVAVVAEEIRKFNAAFAADPRLTSGAAYWDFYYSETGDNTETSRTQGYRQAIAREVFKTVRPKSVLDVGCGRGWLRSFAEGAAYLGVDSSTEALAVASRMDPTGDYKRLDIVAETPPRAELVVLSGVLPYLSSERQVRSAFVNAAAAAKRIFLFSGLEKAVGAWNRPKTFFTTDLGALMREQTEFEFVKLGHCGQEVFYMGVRRHA